MKKVVFIWGKLLPIIPKDISMMNEKKIRIDKSVEKNDCEFSDKYFLKCKVDVDQIENHMKILLKNKSLEMLHYFKKFYILYVFVTLLFPRSNRTISHYLLYVIDNYAWANALHQDLMNNIRASVKKTSGLINGCAMALEVSTNLF